MKGSKPDMNNYCRNCGQKIDPNLKLCTACGAEIFTNRVVPNEKKIELELQSKKEKKYIAIIILLFVSSYLIPLIGSQLIRLFSNLGIGYIYNSILSIVSPLLSLSAIIFLIYARITMRGSKAIRILFIIFIVMLIIRVLLFLLIMIACMGLLGVW